MSNDMTRRLLGKMQKKLAGKVDDGQLRMIAGQFKKSDFADEAKLRQLIRTLAAVSGTMVTEEKEERIIQMFREKQIDPGDLQSLRQWLR